MNELDTYKAFQHKVLGEFFHEIKTPLAIMRTHLESEISNEKIPLEVRQKLVLDVEEISRMNVLLNDVRMLLDGEEEKLREEFEKSSLLELVMDVVQTLEPLANEKKQKLSLISKGNISIEMHTAKLKQLFFNLIHNAIKYTPEGGDISVIFLFEDEKVCVEVIDNGIGISKEDQVHVFEAFFRVGGSSENGVGLGLAVSSAIANLHEAGLSVDSTLGEGTCFKLCFKRALC